MDSPVLRSIFALTLAALFLAGCTDDPVFPEHPITVQITGLPPLGPTAYYQLWISYPAGITQGKSPVPDHNDAQFFSAGRFNITSSGTVTGPDGTGSATFTIPPGYNPNLIIDGLVSVERTGETTSIPGARLLGGDFQGTASQGTATLLLNGADAFATTIDTAGINQMFGSYVLDAPTGADTTGYAHGVWFVNAAGGTLRSGLILPPQPLITTNPMWTYEGWLIHRMGGGQMEYISLGRFDNPNLRDLTSAGPGAGPDTAAAYLFPGEDFVAAGMKRMLNDTTYGLAISVQPTNAAIPRPLITLLQRDTIPPAIGRRVNDALYRVYPGMQVRVVVDR